MPQNTTPLEYHRQVAQHLREHLPSLWATFASDTAQSDAEGEARLHLLQTTFALRRGSYAALYEVADAVAEALGIPVPVELYQGDHTGPLGADMVFGQAQARVVLHGPVVERLQPDALRALLAHALAHHRLWTLDHGDPVVAQRCVQGMVDTGGLTSAAHTAHLLALSTEVFCDQASVAVAGLDASVRLLVTMGTHLDSVSADDFLAQSEALAQAQGTGPRTWTHPEAHIRALAMQRFAAASDPSVDVTLQADLRRLIEGPVQLDGLDLLGRWRLTQITRHLVGHLLSPAWFRTDAVMGHTRLMFDDDLPAFVPWSADPDTALQGWGDSVREYLTAVLLDYIAVDPDLDALPLARAHVLAEPLGLAHTLVAAVHDTLKRPRRDIARVVAERDRLLADADAPSTGSPA